MLPPKPCVLTEGIPTKQWCQLGWVDEKMAGKILTLEDEDNGDLPLVFHCIGQSEG
jgi:hypothetical protein